MHTDNQRDDVILAKEYQEHMKKENRKDGVMDQGKNKKRFIVRKWTDKQYHVHDNADVTHKDVKMYCNKNQLPEL